MPASITPPRLISRLISSPASRRFAGPWLVVLHALLAVALVVFEVATWDHVTPGVVALGEPVGGLTRDQAAERLQTRAARLLERRVRVLAADQEWDRSAREMGLRLQVADALDASYAVGREGNPLQRLGAQLSALLRGADVGLGDPLEMAALEAAIRRMADAVDRPVLDAAVSVDKQGNVQTSRAQVGRSVDVAASAERVAQALVGNAEQADLVVRETQPRVTDAMAEPARVQAERMLGPDDQPPLVLRFQDQQLPLTRADVGPLLSVQPARAGGHLEVRVDEDAAGALAHLLAAELHQDPVDARFDWNAGDLRVIRPASPGRDLDEAATRGLLVAALVNTTRNVSLPVTISQPAIGSDDPAALGIRELIDRGSTSFAGSIPEKRANIRLAAERLNGTVVPPGATFSFNKEVGPTTLDAGFQWGFAIEGGAAGPKTVPSVAGGICQVATTLFQSVFWAGYPVEERYSHAYWIPAYTSRGTVGLDVTVDPDTNLDFKWTNATDAYVLIQAGVQGDTVEFALYGKRPTWKVEVDPARTSNPRPSDPTPIRQEEPGLAWGQTLQVESPRDGFDVDVTRRVTLAGGGEPRTLRLHSSYAPSRSVTLVGTGGRPN